MPKMKVNPEETKAPKPVPAGWYEVRIKDIKMAKSPKGYNYKAFGQIVNDKPENNDKPVWIQANNGITQARCINDLCHSLGFTLESDGTIPGDWTLKDPNKPDDWDGAQYSGPLLGKITRVELVIGNWQGNDRNELKQVQCKIPDCKTRFPEIQHQTEWRGKQNR